MSRACLVVLAVADQEVFGSIPKREAEAGWY